MKRSNLFFFALSIVLVAVLKQAAHAEVHVPSIIGDNMVLQQGQRVRIWGTAQPGERVTVTFKSSKADATADGQGRWQTLLEPFKAGGPFAMTIAGSNTLTFSNVLIGEVWICSGQSNMEWPLVNAKGGTEAVAQANYPEVRLFTVRKKTAASALDDLEGRWVVTTPEQVPQFSAVGYFFGLELYQHLKVPVGLIHSSWGGTPAEAWTSQEMLAAMPTLKPILERYQKELQQLPQRQEELEAKLAEWDRANLYQDVGNKGEALGYAATSFAAADWKIMKLPQTLEAAGLNIDGSVWFRKEIDVPASWVGKDLILSLGPIDDFDVTYFNGARVGATGSETQNSYLVPRRYKVSGSVVHAGSNLIAVRVFDRGGGGGFNGVQEQMSLAPTDGQKTDAVSLAGDWHYKEELALVPKKPDWGTRPSLLGVNNPNSPGVLFNAMIAPLTRYAIRGAIWYQGESNASRAYQYRTLFPAMIRNWRAVWGEGDFPFYFVQLANWQPTKVEPSESEWAELREAQTMTLREPHTGMAVIIDIGDKNDIHPRNKVDVGHRLAVWALADTYGQKIEPAGPLYDASSVEGDKIRVKFKHIDGGLTTGGGGPPRGFAIAGGDHKFHWGEARIDGDSVIVWSNDVPQPVAVRYGWADNPDCNLYNKADLPASPFRTDDWPGLTVGKYRPPPTEIGGSVKAYRRKQILLLALLLVRLGAADATDGQQRYVSTHGKTLISPNGKPLLLKGINLGNWLVPEGYMFKFKTANSPRLIYAVIDELIGEDEARKFWKSYRDNYISAEDIRFIKRSGFNSVRVPFNYRLFVSEGEPAKLEGEGYELLDRVVSWCRKEGLFVVLDMHAAPGGQTGDNIDDSWGYPFLFESSESQQLTINIWRKIAARYHNEPTVLGYDLLNEPIAHYFDTAALDPKLEPLYRNIVSGIREVDKNHIIFLGGAQWDTNFKIFGPPFDDKLGYTFHKYWMDVNKDSIKDYVDFRDKYNVPIWMGESGENTDEWVASFRALLEQNEIGWCFWPYKKMEATTCIVSINRPAEWDTIVSFANTPHATFEDLRKSRPAKEKIQKALNGLLQEVRFANCRINQGYLKALGLGHASSR